MRKQMVALLAGAMLMMATSAMATPITAIQMSATGASSITVYDGATTLGAADISSKAGIVGWTGELGNFDLTMTAGSTAPAIGSSEAPQMHLTGSATSGSAGGLFTVKFSSTDFGPLSNGLSGFLSSMGGIGGTVQSLDVYFDASNTLFGTATQIADLGTLGSFYQYSGIPASNPFSLTMIASIDLGASSAGSFDDSVAPVPEPGTMMLLGLGMFGMAVYGKRRMNKEA